jgi:CheY-like chemotaxis protein/anti-sigma regulatory factor (Ser/Thr protein kinase)
VETALEPVPPVPGQAAELREVLINLIFNAVEAMPLGGGIVLKTRLVGDRVEITVDDTGFGMSKAVQSRAFEPFYTTKSRGTGLGLSVAYGIIARHRGEILVASREGRGTTVTILLPVASEAPPAEPVPSLAAPPVPPARILVIDDEAGVRDALMEMLSTHSHLVTGAASGPEGLALLERHHFDLVLTDLGMPGMTGWEVARRVKAHRPETPVVLITGWGASIDADQQRRSGVDLILFKPFQMEELFSALQVLAGGSKRKP